MSCCSGKTDTPQRVLNSSLKAERKVVIVGESGVGKTSIINLYVKGKFSERNEVTLGGSFLQAKVPLQAGQVVTLDVWDTAGQERYRSMINMFYRNATAAIIVFDVTNYDSFKQCEFWVKKLLDQEPNCSLFLVANKSDLEEKAVDYDLAKSFAQANNMKFITTSAKNNENVQELFRKVAEAVMRKSVKVS